MGIADVDCLTADEEMRAQAIVRSYCYKLLSCLFACPPDAVVAERLYDAETIELFGLFLDEGDLACLQAWSDKWRGFDGTSRAAWLTEQEGAYNKLFVGPARPSAPPWESVWRGSEGLMFQKSTLEVRELYRREGLSVLLPGREADDHVAFELDYLAHVCAKEARDAERGADAAERVGFVGRLLEWVPRFADALDDAPFYAMLGRVLVAMLNADASGAMTDVR